MPSTRPFITSLLSTIPQLSKCTQLRISRQLSRHTPPDDEGEEEEGEADGDSEAQVALGAAVSIIPRL